MLYTQGKSTAGKLGIMKWQCLLYSVPIVINSIIIPLPIPNSFHSLLYDFFSRGWLSTTCFQKAIKRNKTKSLIRQTMTKRKKNDNTDIGRISWMLFFSRQKVVWTIKSLPQYGLAVIFINTIFNHKPNTILNIFWHFHNTLVG